MQEELPKWDIIPEITRRESLRIPEMPDDNWCAFVNYLYAGKNYRTQVIADHYWLPRLDNRGVAIPGHYDPIELSGPDKGPEFHSFVGVFVQVGLRPDVRSSDYISPLQKIPFATLAQTEDLDDGRYIRDSRNNVILAPLASATQLILERD